MAHVGGLAGVAHDAREAVARARPVGAVEREESAGVGSAGAVRNGKGGSERMEKLTRPSGL